jgi:ribonuclease P protein component
MPMDQSFPNTEHLKGKTLIDELFSKGKSVTAFPLRMYYIPLKDNEISGFKVGVSVPKRIFKLAVHRNRIKRLLRESFRKNKYLVYNGTTQHFALLIVYIGKETPDYEFVNSKFKKLVAAFLKAVA